MTFREYIIETDLVFHATTQEAGHKIEKDGFLKPGQKSIWGTQPVKSGVVYVTTEKNTAEQYLPEILRRTKSKKGSIVIAKPEWRNAVPDEDAVFEHLQTAKRGDSIWKYFEGGYEYFHGGYNPSDSQLAYDMQDLADTISPSLKKKIISKSNTVGFTKPLKVVKVERK